MRLALASHQGSGIEAFARRHRAVLIAASFAAASLHILVQSCYVAPRQQLVEGLIQVNAFLDHENNAFGKAVRTSGSNMSATAAIVTPAATLTRLVATAAAGEVRVDGLVPEGAIDGVFTTKASGDFRNLVRFLARLERLHVVVQGLELTTSNASNGRQLESLLTIAPGPDAIAESTIHAPEVPDLSSLLNPFAQRACAATIASAKAATAKGGTPSKLSAITLIGAQTLVTIDGLDYAVGDKVGNYRVAEVSPDSVRLTGESGAETGCLVLALPAIVSGTGQADPEVPMDLRPETPTSP